MGLIEEKICFICFNIIENHTFVPTSEWGKIVNNCFSHLHTVLVNETVKENVNLNMKNNLSICKSCFGSAVKLAQLNQQLVNLQKEISDLTVEFSLAVFYRRNQTSQKNGTNIACQNSKIEIDVSDLPPHLFAAQKNTEENVKETENEETQNLEYESFQPEASDSVLICGDVKLEDDEDLTAETFDREDQFFPSHLTDDEIGPLQECESQDRHSSIGNNQNKRAKLINSEIEIHVGESSSVHISGQSRRNISKSSQRKRLRGHSSLKCSVPRKSDEKTETNEGSYEVEVGLQFEHQEIQTKGKSYNCTFCYQAFNNVSSKFKHQKCHVEERPYQCLYCEKAFRGLSDRTKHHRIHTGEKPFKCAFCDKSFRNSSDKTRHERIHTGEKPFECSYCDKTFRNSHAALEHQRTHTKEKPYKCFYCEETFMKVAARIRHQKQLHTG